MNGMTTNGKLFAGIIALALLVGGLVLINRLREDARPEPAGLDAAIPVKPVRSPRFPAPRMRASAPSQDALTGMARPTNWLAKILDGESSPKPTSEQIAPYLDRNRRSAESLLAAMRVTGDPAFLREAMEKYPNDPQVAYAAVFNEKSPEAHRHWLDALKKSAPDNALGFYLSSLDFFQSGQTDLAVHELLAANGKTRWQDYAVESILSAEEAYRAAGYSEIEAKASASFGLPLPQLAQLKNLSQNIGELANRYRESGDVASAQATVNMGLNLAQRVSEGSGSSWIIQDLVGIASELKLLESADPASPYDGLGRTIQDRRNELSQVRDEIKRLGRQSESVMLNLSEPDLIRFLDRWVLIGELDALRWAANRQP